MPRRRQFRYEALLRVRQRQEDLKAQALASVRRDIQSAERQRAELARRQLLMLEHAGRAARAQFDARDVHRYYLHERHLARMGVERDADLARLRQVEDQRRAELEEAMKHRRIVERLKERHERSFLAEVLKDEQRLSDETATNRAAMARTREQERRDTQ